MALLPIITAPDPRLKRVAQPVKQVDARIRKLMDDMLDTMYAAPGIGLAAPQVGELVRVIVVDIARDGAPRNPLKMANPEIVKRSKETCVYEEGCLSLPEQFAEVTRPKDVTIRYLGYDNKIHEIEADGLLATCIQHEMDHLEGVLFVDHISALRRGIILRKLSKARKTKALEPV
jgi:peptide deformylase